MVVRVELRGLAKVNKFIKKLPKKVSKELTKTNTKFMEDVRDTAIKIAPKDTGALSNTIILEPVRKGKNVKKWKIIVDAPYAVFQEKGFKPHLINPTQIISDKYPVNGSWYVKKNTPFIAPAVEQHIKKLNKKLSNAIDKAIRSSK